MSRVKTVAALLAGLVIAPAGGAIAFQYGKDTGWSIKSVGGVLALTGGLFLLGKSGRALVGLVPGWRRWLAVPAGLVVAYVVAFPVTIAVAATNVPRNDVGSDTPAAFGFDFTEVTLPTSDGIRLAGWYVPSKNRAAVVAVPGASSSRSSVLRQGAVLARHGYGVLFLDPRGQGRSGGRAMNLGWYGDRDVAGALDWLQQRSDVDPGRIGALGESMGGEEALGALAADGRLRAVVGEGATNRVSGDLSWLSEVYGVRGWLQERINWVTTTLTDLLTAARRPITLRAAVAAAAPRPVLLIAAGQVEDEAKAAEAIRQGSPGTVAVWVVPGAGHTGGLRAEPAEWERRVVSFFDATLIEDGKGQQQEVQ